MKLRRTIAIIGGIVLCVVGLIVLASGIPMIKSMDGFIKNSCYLKIFFIISWITIRCWIWSIYIYYRASINSTR